MANFIGHIRAFMGYIHDINVNNIVECMDRLWESTCITDDNSNFENIAADILTCVMNYESLLQLARDIKIRGCNNNPAKAITTWYINTNIM